MVAEQLGLPMLGSLNSVDIGPGAVRGERQGEGGTLSIHTQLPAIVTVTERTAEARFPSFKGILTAKRKPIETLTLTDLGLSLSTLARTGRTVVISATKSPSRPTGRKIFDEGNAANELAAFLVAGRLV